MKILATLAAFGMTLCAVAAFADAPAFLTRAAQGGMTEVAAGELAASKATDPDVRAFGTMMVRDHGAANQKVAALAKSKGVPLPDSAGDANQATLDSLRALNGADFDRAYIAQMVKAHQATQQLLKSEIAKALMRTCGNWPARCCRPSRRTCRRPFGSRARWARHERRTGHDDTRELGNAGDDDSRDRPVHAGRKHRLPAGRGERPAGGRRD